MSDPEPADLPEVETTDDGAESAPKGSSLGGGGLLLGSAKLWFLIASYVTSTTLAWIWREKAGTFGDYQVVARLISLPNMVLIQTLLFAVSRPLAEQYAQGLPAWGPLRRRGFKIAVGLGGSVTLVLLLGADVITGTLLGDESLATPLRAVSPVALIYAVYAVNIGSVNASRRFAHQAGLDIFMGTVKCVLILGAAFAGFSLAVTIGGFTVASALALTLSVAFVIWIRPRHKGPEPVEVPPVAAFAGVLVVFTLLANLLVVSDLLILKGLTDEASKDAVGYYSGALLVAMVPYSLMVAVSLVMFPLIASLRAQGDPERTRSYVSETLRVCVGLLAFMSVVGSACAEEILSLIFPPAYAANATPQLRLMVLGFAGYSLIVTSGWILNSARRSPWALGLLGGSVVLVVGGAFAMVPSAGPDGAARAVGLAGGVGAVAALGVLWKVFGAHLDPWFLLKILVAAALVVLAAGLWDVQGRVMILVKLTAVSLLFLAVAGGTRAVTWGQLRALRRAT